MLGSIDIFFIFNSFKIYNHYIIVIEIGRFNIGFGNSVPHRC